MLHGLCRSPEGLSSDPMRVDRPVEHF